MNICVNYFINNIKNYGNFTKQDNILWKKNELLHMYNRQLEIIYEE